MELTTRQKFLNFLLTFIQYVSLIGFIILTPKWAATPFWLAVEIAGIALALWAIAVMMQSKINIAPAPRKDARLITSGPYRLIRHPMYTSIVLALTPLIITHYDSLRAIILAVLYINLIFKMFFEEGLLKEYFPGYKDYMKSTQRMIPWLF